VSFDSGTNLMVVPWVKKSCYTMKEGSPKISRGGDNMSIISRWERSRVLKRVAWKKLEIRYGKV
jgi:hypothetical protein